MQGELYNMMDWPTIEAIVYSEYDEPHNILGPHITEQGILIQGFFPTAERAVVKVGSVQFEMEQVDEAGFYAVLIPRKKVPEYTYIITYENEKEQNIWKKDRG